MLQQVLFTLLTLISMRITSFPVLASQPVVDTEAAMKVQFQDVNQTVHVVTYNEEDDSHEPELDVNFTAASKSKSLCQVQVHHDGRDPFPITFRIENLSQTQRAKVHIHSHTDYFRRVSLGQEERQFSLQLVDCDNPAHVSALIPILWRRRPAASGKTPQGYHLIAVTLPVTEVNTVLGRLQFGDNCSYSLAFPAQSSLVTLSTEGILKNRKPLRTARELELMVEMKNCQLKPNTSSSSSEVAQNVVLRFQWPCKTAWHFSEDPVDQLSATLANTECGWIPLFPNASIPNLRKCNLTTAGQNLCPSEEAIEQVSVHFFLEDANSSPSVEACGNPKTPPATWGAKRREVCGNSDSVSSPAAKCGQMLRHVATPAQNLGSVSVRQLSYREIHISGPDEQTVARHFESFQYIDNSSSRLFNRMDSSQRLLVTTFFKCRGNAAKVLVNSQRLLIYNQGYSQDKSQLMLDLPMKEISMTMSSDALSPILLAPKLDFYGINNKKEKVSMSEMAKAPLISCIVAVRPWNHQLQQGENLLWSTKLARESNIHVESSSKGMIIQTTQPADEDEDEELVSLNHPMTAENAVQLLRTLRLQVTANSFDSRNRTFIISCSQKSLFVTDDLVIKVKLNRSPVEDPEVQNPNIKVAPGFMTDIANKISSSLSNVLKVDKWWTLPVGLVLLALLVGVVVFGVTLYVKKNRQQKKHYRPVTIVKNNAVPADARCNETERKSFIPSSEILELMEKDSFMASHCYPQQENNDETVVPLQV